MSVRGPALFAVLLVGAGCGGGQVGKMRFVNQPPVWRVDDRRDVSRMPEERSYPRTLYFADRSFFTLATRRLSVPEPRRATGVNALGEVPDSTWFENRIGVRDLTPEEVARGPNVHGGPDMSAPWKVVGGKSGGTAVGFVIEDSRGIRYLIKFDERAPVVETAADVVVQRLLWAAGYHVPEDSIAYIRREQLILGEGAKIKVAGEKRLMTEADLEKSLAKVQWNDDGTVRVLASKFLDGVPIGGFADEGVREDDPNDTIPHEDRRELRGLFVFFAWTNQVDVKEDNTLDMWAEDPENPGAHYVRHYLVDFGKALGAMGRLNYRPDAGHTYAVDFEYIFKSLPALGLWLRPWEGTSRPRTTGVGVIDAEHFDPDNWKGVTSYLPFLRRDDYDMFWAARILLRFEEEHIRAAVEQGRYDDPSAVDYIVRTLVGRQRKIARHVLGRVNPLDEFSLSGADGERTLCFSDLWLKYGLQSGVGATSYRVTAFDYAGNRLGHNPRLVSPGSGRTCVEGLSLGQTHSGYTIVRIATHRGNEDLTPVEVHLAKDPASGDHRIVGVNRR